MKIRNVVVVVFIIMIVSFIVTGILFNTTGGFKFAEKQHQVISEEKTLQIDNVTEIYIYSLSSNVNLISTDSNELKVNLHGTIDCFICSAKYELKTSVDGDKLSIEVSASNWGGIYRFLNVKLDVMIPDSYNNNLKIKTSSADTYAENFEVDEFIYTTSSGELTLNSFTFTKGDLTTSSGDINGEDISGNTQVYSSSGGINLSYSQASDFNIDIKTSSGDVDVNIFDTANFHLYVKTSSGNIYNKFPITIKGNMDDDFLEGIVGESSDNTITINTSSGDIVIN